MIALWILLGILLFLFLIGMLRGTLAIEYATSAAGEPQNSGKPILRLKILGLPLLSVPKKRKRVKLRRYSRRAMRRRAAKAAKKEARLAKKKNKKSENSSKKEDKKGKNDISGTIGLVLDLVRLLLSRLSKHLKIKIARVKIAVATPDAAETAILYGTVSQSVAYLLEFLEQNANLAYTYRPEVEVGADFSSTRTRADISLSFSIRVWQVLGLLFHAALHFLKHKNGKNQ